MSGYGGYGDGEGDGIGYGIGWGWGGGWGEQEIREYIEAVMTMTRCVLCGQGAWERVYLDGLVACERCETEIREEIGGTPTDDQIAIMVRARWREQRSIPQPRLLP